MDRGAWQATVHRVTELDTIEMTYHACVTFVYKSFVTHSAVKFQRFGIKMLNILEDSRLRFSGDGGAAAGELLGSFSWIFMCLCP